MVAHRGFTCCFPENTLSAIEGAFANGADAVEIDIRLTRDRMPVVFHDETLDRTTNGSGRVSTTYYADVSTLDACSWYDESFGACQIPTLRSALETAQNKGSLILDLKGGFYTCDLINIANEIERYGMLGRVAISASDTTITTHVRRAIPGMPTALFVSPSLIPVDEVTARHSDLVFISSQLLDALPAHTLESARARGLRLGVWKLYGEPNVAELRLRNVNWIVTEAVIDSLLY